MSQTYVWRHIKRLPATQIFTTREVLQYGSRGAVDTALYRLVLSKSITRLARGVFVRDAGGNPTRKDIVRAKAKAWGKTIFKHAQKILKKLGLADANIRERSTFDVNAHSSSFGTIHGRVYLQGVGARKIGLCRSAVGKMVYALWHLGESDCTTNDVSVASRSFGRVEREEFRLKSALMPAWLHHLCYFRYAPRRVL